MCEDHVLMIIILDSLVISYNGCMIMMDLVRTRHVYVTLSLVMVCILRSPRGRVNMCNGYLSRRSVFICEGGF